MVPYDDFPTREDNEPITKWAARIIGMNADEFEDLLPKVESSEYFGQKGAKQQIAPFLKREDSFPNTLLLGRPGIGKTRMARWIAGQRKEPFEEFLCPVNPDALPSSGIIMRM